MNKFLGVLLIIMVVLFVACVMKIIYTSHVIASTDDVAKTFAHIDSMKTELDSLRLLWYETKIAIMETAIFRLARNNWVLNDICEAIQTNDSVWMGIINKKQKELMDNE